MYQILQQARHDYERIQLNTVVSSAMKLLNLMDDISLDPHPQFMALLLQESMGILLRILAPIAPHICHALWEYLGFPGEVLETKMPKVLSEALKTEQITLMVQVNGKLRGKIDVAQDATEEIIQAIALADDKIKSHVKNQNFKKVIYVPGKLINLVVEAE